MSRNERRKRRLGEKARYLIFVVGVILAFCYIAYGAYQLQIVQGPQYAEEAGVSGVKTIPIKGLRGMITDRNSVILAKSETVYNVTFQRTNAQIPKRTTAPFPNPFWLPLIFWKATARN